MFNKCFKHIYYYYPDILNNCPISYDIKTETEISFIGGFPTMADINEIESDSLVIIDDQSEKLVKSEDVSILYRVVSGKRNISIISVVQNYFLQASTRIF